MSRLLVSVRNATEAEAALAGGADLIDVKEPANGPLGRADQPIIESILQNLRQSAAISAACGELELDPPPLPSGLTFAKFGLEHWANRDWPSAWERVRAMLPAGCAPVAVAYADWQLCDAPRPDQVIRVAVEHRFGAFLLDTFDKNATHLLNRLSIEAIGRLTRECQGAGVPVALAGSLGIPEIKRLLGVEPDWFAVRGAACQGGRESPICEKRVRELTVAAGFSRRDAG